MGLFLLVSNPLYANICKGVFILEEKALGGNLPRYSILVRGALCVAMSVALSYFKLFTMPQGGSITLEMTPLLFFSYMYGAKRGICAGAMSGLLQIIFGGYVVHPLQALLDYPLAFGCIGAAGMFGRHVIIGTVLAGIGRLVCHILSGVVFFASYAPVGQNAWVYAAVYNATFLTPTLILAAAAALLLWKRLGSFLK